MAFAKLPPLTNESIDMVSRDTGISKLAFKQHENFVHYYIIL